MKLLRDEKEKGMYGDFKTAIEYIEHYGIFPAKETKYTLTYYEGYDWHKGEPREKYKKFINIKTGVYKCWELSRIVHQHRADFCDNYMR